MDTLDRPRLGPGHRGRLFRSQAGPHEGLLRSERRGHGSHITGPGGGIGVRNRVLYEDASAAVHHRVEAPSAHRSARDAQVRLAHQLDLKPHGLCQLLQLSVEGGRTGDDTHLFARGRPRVEGGADHGCRHDGEEDEGYHSEQAAPQALPDLAPSDKSGASEEPPFA